MTPVPRSLPVLFAAAVLSWACAGGQRGIPVHRGSYAGLSCPSGTLVYGSAPPKGKLVYCADPRKSGLEARSGPSIDWGCKRCTGGRSLRGEYVLGKKDGAWSLVTREGVQLDASTWKAGRRVGNWRGFFADGTPRFLRRYDDSGHPDGVEWENWGNGRRRLERSWSEGLRDGVWKTWNRRGLQTSQEEFDRDRKYGAWKTFDDEGRVVRIRYYDKGRVVREARVVGGELRIIGLDKQGRPAASWTERDGRRHGTLIDFHPGTEVPRRKSTWVDGEQTGPFSLYRRDGRKYAAGMMVRGKRQCGWRVFDEKGHDISRMPALAAALVGAARADPEVPDDSCRWTLDTAPKLLRGAPAATTVTLARWLLERAAAGPETDTPPAGPPSLRARLEAMDRLRALGDRAAAELAFDKAALLYGAVLVEADRALGGGLLELPAGASAAARPRWPGPRPDKAGVAAFSRRAAEALTGMRKLLWEKTRGDKAARKAGRVTCGRFGVTKLSFRKLRTKLGGPS